MSSHPYEPDESPRRTREVLRESEERFRLLVEGVKDYAIFMLDVDGYITTWNPGAQRIKGYRAEEIIGEHFSTFYTPGDLERGHPEEELRIAAVNGRYEEEGIRVRKDGSVFWANVLITALRDERGELSGFAKVTRDITERKEAEERERQLASEQAALERATIILESISDAFFAVDEEWCVTYVNNKAEEMWGRSRDEVLGERLWDAFPEEVGSEYYRQLTRAMKEGVTAEFEAHSPVSDAWVAGRAYPSREGLAVYLRDVSDRKRAEESARRIREAERQRIARDLHDGPLQDIAFTAAALGLVMPEVGDTDLHEQLLAASDAISRGADGLREAVHDLRVEDEEGRPLAEVIEFLVRRHRAMARHVRTSLEVQGEVFATPLGETGTQVSRVVREALTNARRHSGARRVRVSLRMDGDDVIAEVTDDGVGLGGDVAPGMGFASMRERAEIIGGSLEIESEERRGTSVRLRVPLPWVVSG